MPKSGFEDRLILGNEQFLGIINDALGGGIIFNKRRSYIIRRLISNNGEYPVKDISRECGVTERTIRYDLEEINSLLTKKHISIHIIIQSGNIVIKSNIYNRFDAIKRIKEMDLDFCEYIPSANERRYIILLELFFASDFITVDYLSEKMCISSSTIKNDLGEVRQWLIKAGINPQFVPSKGLYMEGEERLIRNAALKIFRNALALEQYIGLIKKDTYGFTRNYIGIMFDHIFEDERIKRLRYCIDSLQQKFDIIFSDYIYADLTIFLGILLRRVQLGYHISISREDATEISRTDIHKKVEALSKLIFKYLDISLGDDEIIYISQYVLSSDTGIPPTIYNYPYLLEDYVYITDMITEVSGYCNIDLTRNSNLYNALSSYGLALYYRQRYRIEAYNPYIDEIKENYPGLFEIVKSSMKSFKPDMEYTLTEAEIGFVTLYFASALEEPQNKLKVLVLCEVGFPIGNLLATRLKLMFNVDVVAIEYISQAEKALSEHEVDLIITTSSFTPRNMPYAVVSPLLTEEDILSIRKLIEKMSYGCGGLAL